MIQSERVRPYFLLVLLVGAFALTIFIFAPFLKPLALAAVFAVVLQGVYRTVSTAFNGRLPGFAAFLTVLISVVFILLPLSLLGTSVAREARSLYLSLEEGSASNVVSNALRQFETSLDRITPELGDAARAVSADIDTYTQDALAWITSNAGSIFSSLSSLVLSFFIFFIALYYLLRDGKRVRQAVISLSPLTDQEDEEVLNRLALAVNSVIKGSLTIALIQGALTTVGLALFGVPNPLLWGTLAAMSALIPGIGTSLVFIPAVAFLFFTGAQPQAFGLLIWGVAAVGLIDNLLGPRLVGKRMQLHPLFVLLSVLGGLALFGPAGIFLGPLSVSLLFALLSIYANLSKGS